MRRAGPGPGRRKQNSDGDSDMDVAPAVKKRKKRKVRFCHDLMAEPRAEGGYATAQSPLVCNMACTGAYSATRLHGWSACALSQ